MERKNSPSHPDDKTSSEPAGAPYQVAEEIFMARVEQLQRAGQLLRPSQIASEEEQDEHFDQLSRVYRAVCDELGLLWPPPALDEDEGSGGEI